MKRLLAIAAVVALVLGTSTAQASNKHNNHKSNHGGGFKVGIVKHGHNHCHPSGGCFPSGGCYPSGGCFPTSCCSYCNYWQPCYSVFYGCNFYFDPYAGCYYRWNGSMGGYIKAEFRP